MADAGDDEFTGIHMMSEFPFRNFADTERLLEGLRKAGVPELPKGVDPKSKDRLTGAEIKALIFGHLIEGRERETGNAYRRQTAMDGTADVTVGTEALKHRDHELKGTFFAAGLSLMAEAVAQCSAIQAEHSKRGTSICGSVLGTASSSRS